MENNFLGSTIPQNHAYHPYHHQLMGALICSGFQTFEMITTGLMLGSAVILIFFMGIITKLASCFNFNYQLTKAMENQNELMLAAIAKNR